MPASALDLTTLAARSGRQASQSDGRRARSDASRQLIVEAVLALSREGMLEPNADMIAARAGVGRRTVFRHFKDLDSLYADVHALVMEQIAHITKQPIDGANWEERLESFLRRRVRLFEEILPIKTAADVQRSRSAFLQAKHLQVSAMFREILVFVLPAHIKSDPVRVDSIDLLLSFEAWKRLRTEQGLDAEQAARVQTYALQRILA